MAASLYFTCMQKGLSSVACRYFSAATKPGGAAKIYFAASIRAGREDAKIYKELIEYIKVHGEVLSESEQLGPNIEQEAKGISLAVYI
jgi:hypothetical protein